MLGAPKRCRDSLTVKEDATLLEELLVGDGPFGHLPEEFLGEWLNDVHVSHLGELEIILHSYASFTKTMLLYLG